MILATHAITGAAIASLIPEHPVAAFAAGFASHFLIDAIPHYDYPIYSAAIDPEEKWVTIPLSRNFLRKAFAKPGLLVRDGVDFSADALIGIGVAFIVFGARAPAIPILAGSIGGILPDPLQFFSKSWHHEPLKSLQRFHEWIHTAHRLRESGLVALGVVSQLAFVGAVIAIAKIL